MTELDFKPMPKRFIAWDKHQKDWVTKFLMPSTSDENSADYTCPLTLEYDSKDEKNWLNNDQLIVCQSTDLFDKDGKEIFEGSIIQWGEDICVVEFRNGKWAFRIVDDQFNVYYELLSNVDMVKVIGHALSNPELLEGDK